MNTLFRTACTVIGASVALALSGAAAAQVASPKIVISNVTPNVEIPLVTTSQVQFLSNGDLSVQCRLNAGACPGIGGGTGTVGNAPALFALNASATTVNSGQSFTLSWNSTDSEACYAVSPLSTTGWTSGNRVLPNNSSAAISIGNTGTEAITRTFQIRCFNESGSRTVSSPAITINAGGGTQQPTGDYCQEYYGTNMPTGPNFNAHGFTRVNVGFGTVWSGIQPGGIDGLRGVPGPNLNPAANRYMVIPFILTDDTPNSEGSYFRLAWNQSQLADTPTGSVTVTVSPCPGDFRQATMSGANSTDYYDTRLCRGVFGQTGAIAVNSLTHTTGCYAPKNKQMYINVATYNMYVTSTPADTTCSGNNTYCGVMMKVD